MNKDDIKIQEMILHILDTSLDIPVLSDDLLDRSEFVIDFATTHISKLINSDLLKSSTFKTDNNYVYTQLSLLNSAGLIATSKNLSTVLFQLMKKNIYIPSCDLLFVTYTVDDKQYMSILKLNYKTSYIHYVTSNNNNTKNSIIQQKTTLPQLSQKVDEAIIIQLDNYNILLLEKKCEINGEPRNYLSELYLQSEAYISPKEKLNIITKTADKLNKKYYNDTLDKNMDFKKSLFNQFEETGTIDIEQVVSTTFNNNIEIQKDFEEEIQKKGIKEKNISFTNENSINKISKQKIKTDIGIEINIPIEHYKNSNYLEFMNNPDGTVSLLIKNINKMSGSF
jgi:hypothetical protein